MTPLPRTRLSTLLLLIVVVSLSIGLFVLKRREARLQETLMRYRDLRAEGALEIIDLPLALTYTDGSALEDMLKDVKKCSIGRPKLPAGLPIYVDPIGLQEARQSMTSPLKKPRPHEQLTLRQHLRRALEPLGLRPVVKDGWLMITSIESVDGGKAPDPYLGFRDILW